MFRLDDATEKGVKYQKRYYGIINQMKDVKP